MRNALVIAAFVLFALVDVVVDLREGVPLRHIWHEIALISLGVAAIVWQLVIIGRKDRHLQSLGQELLETKQEYQQWRERARSSAAEIRRLIDEQFTRWELSVSEKDIALLLIKGLTMKEIAEIRQTHERTVRQQATTIYRKAGLAGRQELAAFFLEDILSST